MDLQARVYAIPRDLSAIIDGGYTEVAAQGWVNGALQAGHGVADPEGIGIGVPALSVPRSCIPRPASHRKA